MIEMHCQPYTCTFRFFGFVCVTEIGWLFCCFQSFFFFSTCQVLVWTWCPPTYFFTSLYRDECADGRGGVFFVIFYINDLHCHVGLSS